MKLKDVADVLYVFELDEEISTEMKGAEEKDEGVAYMKFVHRKVDKEKLFFVTPYITQLFSLPFVVSFDRKLTSMKKLYQLINEKVDFMIDKEREEKEEEERKKQKQNLNGDSANPTNDEEERPPFPFTLRLVNPTGEKCPTSAWYHFSIGKELDPNSEDLVDLPCGSTISVDWHTPVYQLKHFRENSKWYDEHPSVKENWDLLNSPIALDQCTPSKILLFFSSLYSPHFSLFF